MLKKDTLNNGMTFVSERIDFVRSIALGIWIKSGSRYEDATNNGISHFIEHMMFKGTSKRTAKELAEEMDRVGGQINAFTSKEYTCFYTVSLDEHFDQSLDILHDMLRNSLFTEADINKEKGVILEEINMYEDSPDELVIDELHYKVWEGHPLSMPILGTSQSLQHIDKKQILRYYHDKFVPENMVICMAGNFEYDTVMDMLNKTFGAWESGESNEANPLSQVKYNSCLTTKNKDIEQVHFSLSFDGLPLGHKDVYPLSIFSTIFGGGVSSRLFQKIREEAGLTYSIYSYTSSFLNAGLFSVVSALNPSQLEEVLKQVVEEIHQVKATRLTADEMLTTKEHLKSSIILGLESSSSRMSSLGKSQLLLGRIRTPDEIIEKINKVTEEDIYRAVNHILDFDKLSLSIVGQTKGINLERIKDLCQMN